MKLSQLKSAELIEKPTIDFFQNRFKDSPHHQGFSFRDLGGVTALNKLSGGLIARNAAVPEPPELRKLVEARGMPWDPAYVDRAEAWWASDERVDGHGDIVRQSWHFDLFEKNSPMPFNHRWDDVPIGRHIDWSVEKRNDPDYKGRALRLLGVFATADTLPFADAVARLARARILVAGSVGFYADKIIDVKDEKERNEMGLGRWGLIFEDNHLLEYSPCTIPANPGANLLSMVQEAGRQGKIAPSDVTVLRELRRLDASANKGNGDAKNWQMIERASVALCRTLWPDQEWSIHKELDEPFALDEEVSKSSALTAFEKLFKATEDEEEETEEEAPPPPAEDEDEDESPAEDEETEGPSPLEMLTETHEMLGRVVTGLDEIKSMLATALDAESGKSLETEPAEDEETTSRLSAALDRFQETLKG